MQWENIKLLVHPIVGVNFLVQIQTISLEEDLKSLLILEKGSTWMKFKDNTKI